MPDLIGMDCAKDYSNFAAAIKGAGVSFCRPLLSRAGVTI
jgi:hypothetical protein